MALDMLYDIIIEGEEQFMIDWGNTPGWTETYRDELDNARLISLVPKNGRDVPVVTVALNDDKRWIIFSRVYGQMTSGKEVRFYAIGWQQRVKGISVKSIQWVYPSGAVECAENPSFVDKFI